MNSVDFQTLLQLICKQHIQHISQDKKLFNHPTRNDSIHQAVQAIKIFIVCSMKKRPKSECFPSQLNILHSFHTPIFWESRWASFKVI